MASINAKKLRKAQRLLIERSEALVEGAYYESYRDIREGINMPELVRALDRKDTEGALRALNIEPAAFAPLRNSLVSVYEKSGKQVMAAMPPLEKHRG